jgi:hypothetical protein
LVLARPRTPTALPQTVAGAFVGALPAGEPNLTLLSVLGLLVVAMAVVLGLLAVPVPLVGAAEPAVEPALVPVAEESHPADA